MANRFPLSAVLAVRLQAEEAEERALTSLLRERQRLQDLRQRLLDELDRWAKSNAQGSGQVAPAAAQYQNYARLKFLQESRRHLETELQAVQAQIAGQQKAYQQARQKREVLSELKAQHERALQAQELRKAQRLLDDLFSARRSWLR